MICQPKQFVFILIISILLVNCKKSEPATPVVPVKTIANILGNKSWKILRAQEGSTTVYQDGRTDSVYPSYRNFLLTLSGQKVKLTEFTSESFDGDWLVSETGGRTYLSLRNLTPAPTNSGGTVEFEVNSATDVQVAITTTKPNLKTGNTINVYTLTLK